MKCAIGLLLLGASAAVAAPPTDPAVDWLMQSAATAPSTQAATPATPATRPAVLKTDSIGDARAGTITLSDGKTIEGSVTTTAERPIRVWVEDDKSYHDLPFASIQSIEAVVTWERLEKEWTFKATGDDEKVYSGRTYPARETAYRFTLIDGTAITGAVSAPLYIHIDSGDVALVLHKRDKGKVGDAIADLVYVKTVTFRK